MNNRSATVDVIASVVITVALLLAGFITVHYWHAVVTWDRGLVDTVATIGRAAWHGLGFAARAYGQAVEWAVSTVTFKHVTLYGEPFHSGLNGGFVSTDGFGHCFGFEWYGTPGFFHGCG